MVVKRSCRAWNSGVKRVTGLALGVGFLLSACVDPSLNTELDAEVIDAPTCGDGLCDASEDSSSCPVDCEGSCLSDPELCGEGEICSPNDGRCIEGECGENSLINDCEEGAMCRGFACVPADPPLRQSVCAGSAHMSSTYHVLYGSISPLDLTGVTARSGSYTLQSGLFSAFIEE